MMRMHIPLIRLTRHGQPRKYVFLLIALWAVFPRQAAAFVLEERYPGLSNGLLKAATLESMDRHTLLMAEGGVVIRESDMRRIVENEDPHMRGQAEKNQFYLLERTATDWLLLIEALKAGIPIEDADPRKVIERFLADQTEGTFVSDEEVFVFYQDAKEMLGEVPFEMVLEDLREYLLKEKKQVEIRNYIRKLGAATPIRINERWVAANGPMALDNPVDRARSSGIPTLAEFTASNCTACEKMEPILENLGREYSESLNIVTIHVVDAHFLASRYGIGSIPVQVFFNANGDEVFRHVGFFPQTEVVRWLAGMGVDQMTTGSMTAESENGDE